MGGKKKEIRQPRDKGEMEGFMSLISTEQGNSGVEIGQEQEGGRKGISKILRYSY